MPPPGPSRVAFTFPVDKSHIWISPSKLPEASNLPSLLKARLETESLWPAKILSMDKLIHFMVNATLTKYCSRSCLGAQMPNLLDQSSIETPCHLHLQLLLKTRLLRCRRQYRVHLDSIAKSRWIIIAVYPSSPIKEGKKILWEPLGSQAGDERKYWALHEKQKQDRKFTSVTSKYVHRIVSFIWNQQKFVHHIN